MQDRGKAEAEDRRRRLAAELRANLLKRKALARERAQRADKPNEGDAASSENCSPGAGSEHGRDE